MDSRNLPTDIKGKLALLDHHKDEIERLTQLLEISKKEVERLETELEPYLASVAPVGKCPAEILVEIFKIYIEENPRLIRRLLLVCRHWYNLIISVPQLWISIPIIIDSTKVDAETEAKSIKPRILAFIKYSRDKSLHINLDLTNLLDPRNYLNYKGGELIGDLDIPWEIDLFEETRDNWEKNKEEMEELPWNISHLYELFDILCGLDLENMQRWESLSISFPEKLYSDELNSILEKLVGDTPNLRFLSLYIHEWDTINLPDHILFSDLSSLRRLVLGHQKLLPVVDLSSSPKLECCEFINPGIFDTLNLASSDFRSIRRLIMRWDRHEGSWRNPPSAMVSMPMLHTLEFRGRIVRTGFLKCNLPSMRNLFIERTLPHLFVEPPEVKPIMVTWGVIHPGHRRVWDQLKTRDALKALLKCYGMIERINIAESVEEDLLFVLEDLKSTGYYLPLLKKIGIIGSWDPETELRVRMIE